MSRGRESRPTRAPEVRIGAPMPKFSCVLDVRETPEKVIGAMIDFSDRRPEILAEPVGQDLPGSFRGREHRRCHGRDRCSGRRSVGAHDLRWTDTAVKSVITDSRLFQAGGTFVFRVEPHGSGSRIHFTIDRKAKTFMGRLVGASMQVSTGAPMKKSFYAVYGKPT